MDFSPRNVPNTGLFRCDQPNPPPALASTAQPPYPPATSDQALPTVPGDDSDGSLLDGIDDDQIDMAPSITDLIAQFQSLSELDYTQHEAYHLIKYYREALQAEVKNPFEIVAHFMGLRFKVLRSSDNFHRNASYCEQKLREILSESRESYRRAYIDKHVDYRVSNAFKSGALDFNASNLKTVRARVQKIISSLPFVYDEADHLAHLMLKYARISKTHPANNIEHEIVDGVHQKLLCDSPLDAGEHEFLSRNSDWLVVDSETDDILFEDRPLFRKLQDGSEDSKKLTRRCRQVKLCKETASGFHGYREACLNHCSKTGALMKPSLAQGAVPSGGVSRAKTFMRRRIEDNDLLEPIDMAAAMKNVFGYDMYKKLPLRKTKPKKSSTRQFFREFFQQQSSGSSKQRSSASSPALPKTVPSFYKSPPSTTSANSTPISTSVGSVPFYSPSASSTVGATIFNPGAFNSTPDNSSPGQFKVPLFSDSFGSATFSTPESVKTSSVIFSTPESLKSISGTFSTPESLKSTSVTSSPMSGSIDSSPNPFKVPYGRPSKVSCISPTFGSPPVTADASKSPSLSPTAPVVAAGVAESRLTPTTSPSSRHSSDNSGSSSPMVVGKKSATPASRVSSKSPSVAPGSAKKTRSSKTPQKFLTPTLSVSFPTSDPPNKNSEPKSTILTRGKKRMLSTGTQTDFGVSQVCKKVPVTIVSTENSGPVDYPEGVRARSICCMTDETIVLAKGDMMRIVDREIPLTELAKDIMAHCLIPTDRFIHNRVSPIEIIHDERLSNGDFLKLVDNMAFHSEYEQYVSADVEQIVTEPPQRVSRRYRQVVNEPMDLHTTGLLIFFKEIKTVDELMVHAALASANHEVAHNDMRGFEFLDRYQNNSK